MKVRMADIAQAADVSVATVSNVLNGANRVGEATRLKVLEIARKMGYQNPEYEGMKKSILLAIPIKHGRIVFDASPFFSEVITGIESACRKNLYELTISHVDPSDTRLVNAMIGDAKRPMLLLATELEKDDIRPFLKRQGPMVVLDSYYFEYNFHCVSINNMKAGFIAAEHLIDCGHSEFGFVASSVFHNNMWERKVGFELALANHGFKLDEKNIFSVNPESERALVEFNELMDKRTEPMPTGLFAYNDIVGLAAHNALKRHGYKIPRDVSMVSMDDIPTITLVNPPLTSIHVPKYSYGYLAAEKLISLIGNQNMRSTHVQIEPYLVPRESVRDLNKE